MSNDTNDGTATDTPTFTINDNQYMESVVHLSSDKNLITDGPLSYQYAQALNKLYAKEVDKETGISLETQANDDIVSKSNWIAHSYMRQQLSNNGQEVGMLYGVASGDVSITDVISVTDAIGGMTEEEKKNSGIIIDVKFNNSNPESNTPVINQAYVNPYINAIECLAEQHGVSVYASLEEYIGASKLKDGKYSGTANGKRITFKIGKKNHTFINATSIKGKGAEVTVTVKNNDVHEITVH